MTLPRLHQEFLQSTGVCTDTREDVKDTLFFALKGVRFDGNRFVQDALDKGCRLAVTEDRSMLGKERVVVVPSSLETLQQMASLHRNRSKTRILAITGSNGKTTTKELISRVLGNCYRVLSTDGNLNNHIGVPLTLLRLRNEEVAVVEMGANHPGEIRALAEITAPDMGIITNVGKAHLEGFGSLEGVLRAKGELYEYLASHGGKALVDGSDTRLMDKAAASGVEVLEFGTNGPLQVSGRITGHSPYLELELGMQGKLHRVGTKMVGAYNLGNILYAAATGIHYMMSPAAIVDAIASYTPENHRSQWIRGRSNSIMLDAYNANPTSMRQAINGLYDLARGPVMLILGDMAELGSDARREHQSLAEWISILRPERVCLVGPLFHEYCTSIPGVRTFRGRKELETHLREDPPKDYHVLLKGSRVMELEKVLDLLKD